ncbi:TetR/AcrR family transcriptional regulator [Serratia fonticola]
MFTDEELSKTRAETLKKLTNAALHLYSKNKFPKVDEITKLAGYSKNTFYKYFTDQASFTEYLIKQLIGKSEAPHISPSDVNVNIDKLFTWGYNRIFSNEALMRDALRVYQEQWAGRKNESDNNILREKGNRREILIEALSPLKNDVSDDNFEKLTKAMAILYGTEPMVILKDMFGMSNDEIIKLTEWMAKAIIKDVKSV